MGLSDDAPACPGVMLDEHPISGGVCVRAHRPAVFGAVASNAIEDVVLAPDIGAVDSRPLGPGVMLDERLRYDGLTGRRQSVLTNGPTVVGACARYGAEDAETEAFVRGAEDHPVAPRVRQDESTGGRAARSGTYRPAL